MPGIPKGHKVLDTVKDKKGFYRIIQRPDGTKYTQTLKLFTQDDIDRKVNADNKALGQFSVKNIEHNAANAMALTAVGGGAATLALHNLTQGRQGKVGRKVRGAAFGNTRPQGVGLKTQAASAGDVRGRVSPNRPPAIVRSVDSFNQRGSTMPQSGNLFNQPKAGSRTISGLRSEPQGTFDPKAQRTAGTRSTAGQRLVKTPTSKNPNTLRLNTEPGKPAGSRVQASASSSSTSAKGDMRPPLGKDKTRTVLGNSSKKGLQQLTSRLSSDVESPKINPKTSSSGGSSMAQTKGSVPANVQKAFQQGRGGTGAGRTNIQAAVDKTVGRTQSGATSRPTGTNTYSQVTAGRGNAGATPSRGAIATTSNTNPNARAAGVPTTNRPGSPSMPSRSSASVGSPGTQIARTTPPSGGPLMRPIPEAKFRVVPPAPGRTNVPGIPKSGGIGGFFKGVGRVLSHPMMAVASAIDMADRATNFRRIPYTGNFGGPSFAKNPYASTSGIPDAKPAGKKETTAPAPAPAQSGGNKPAGGTSQRPSGPAYFPEASRNGSAVRTPDSYLGEAFDYSLQKGTNSGTKYLEHMFRRDKISEDDQQRLRERFNKKVVGDQTLKDEGASRGITENVEGKKSGMGKALLDQYRANNPGNPLQNYKGNTDYGNMRAAAEARLAKK